MVIINGTITLLKKQMLYITTSGLLMEYSGFLLNLRFLLNLYGVRRDSLAYQWFAILNIATFVLIRFPLFVCVEWHLVAHSNDNALDQNAVYVIAMATSVLFAILVNLLHNLIKSDFSRQPLKFQ